MPEFLNKKLLSEYGGNMHAVFGTLQQDRRGQGQQRDSQGQGDAEEA
jgi:hypothetical protein